MANKSLITSGSGARRHCEENFGMLIGLGPVSTQRQALFLRDLREGEVPPCVLQGKGIATSEPIFFALI